MAEAADYKQSALPYELSALEPHISEETLTFHYGKHHAGYVGKLNILLAGKEHPSLEELIMTAEGGVFNNAAQIWNHAFYWDSMKPSGGGEPEGPIKDLIVEEWGSFEAFKKAMTKAAATHFGSGWGWLVQNPEGKLAVMATHDAGNPMKDGFKPLLVVDVWEHAYYIDRRNRRPEYIAAWWNLVNWDFANANLKK